MPNPSSPFGPFIPMQSFFAPWLLAMPTDPDEAKIAEAGPVWGPALASQARLWRQFLDMQRQFWSFYNPLLQATPVFMNGTAKTVAEDEAGLEPAETVDGIPDVFELQARTWNHFLDANRSFWSTVSRSAPGSSLFNGVVNASDAQAQEADKEAPRKAVKRASPARKQAHAQARPSTSSR